MPQDGASPLEVLLQVVRKVFEQSGKWPTRQYVQAVLDQDFHLDLDDALQEASKSLVYSAGTQEGSEVILTVAGLAAAGDTDDVQRFVEALRWCVVEQMGFLPADPGETEQLRLEAEQFRSEWASRGQEVTTTEMVKLRAMLTTEGIYSSIGGEGDSWTVTLDRRSVYPYRDVQTIEDYLAVKRAPAATPAPPVPELELPGREPPREVSPMQLGLNELPAKVREACAILLLHGHFAQGVLEAAKVMRDVLRQASGLDLDGDRLAGKALNPDNPLIVLGDLSTETGRSRQRGVMLIAQGIFGAVRNPLAHHRIVLRPAEARQMVAMIAFVVEAVEACQVPPA
jgi:uncharacterized protein (TIGR02391 family)